MRLVKLSSFRMTLFLFSSTDEESCVLSDDFTVWLLLEIYCVMIFESWVISFSETWITFSVGAVVSVSKDS